jgi:spore cortex formation protein SpoVR/YcgB (stage V sporulation)
MNTLKLSRILFLGVLVLGKSAWAAGGDDPDSSCRKSLTKKTVAPPPAAKSAQSTFRVIESPRVPGDAAKYRAYVSELTQPGGVLDQLGIKMTGQVVEFLQARDLNALTSGMFGGYPVRHYLDGSSVVQSLTPRGGFALEMVSPGPKYQHGLYRDDNPYEQQISIIDHVVGHNHFALHSGLAHYRIGQGLEASRKLDQILADAYEGVDKAAVQRFYLWLGTASSLVDVYAPIYNPSKDFEPKLSVTAFDPLGRSPARVERHPRFETENVFQAFAANIAPNEPPWKREMMEAIDISKGFQPALIHTQIMNEGWASIMQEIIPRHTRNHHYFSFWFRASQVMQTEETPNLRNPYSLGVAGWRHLRERFEEKPEIASLPTQIEKDARFIAYATDLIGRLTDEEFIRLIMDQRFVDKFKLSVVRRAKDGEWVSMDPPRNLPPGQSVAQWIVVSREADRVAQMVINKVLKPKYYFRPRVRLVDFNRPGSGDVELVLDDEVGAAIPLKEATLAPSLYALANVIGKPVSLECTIAKQPVFDLDAWFRNQSLPPWMRKPQKPKLNRQRVRVVVAPNGAVKVYSLGSYEDWSKSRPTKTQEFLDQKHTDQYQDIIRDYLDDLYLDDEGELERLFESNPILRNLVAQMVSRAVETVPYDNIVSQSPNAAGAITEFKSMLDARLAKAMVRAIRSKGGINLVNGQVRVKALPSVVNITFDPESIDHLLAGVEPAPISQSLNLNKTFEKAPGSKSGPFDSDQGADGSVGGVGGNPGDRFWGPGDADGGGNQAIRPGEGENDLSWVEIPQDLYEKFLGEIVRLPILNRKPGRSRTQATKPGGRRNRIQGQMLPQEIVDNAFKRGVGSQIESGKNPFDDISDTIADGFEMLQPRDWVVKSARPTKKPDVKAVVTFVLDASGSTAMFMESFKRFVHDMETLVRANYKGFDFRYIVFDTAAHVMKTKDEFFRAELGGGTLYKMGIERARKLFEDEYPRAKWDRYTFVLGDYEDFGTEAMPSIERLLEESDYFGAVAGLYRSEQEVELFSAIGAASETNEAIGKTVLDDEGGYTIRNLKEVLRNEIDD